MAYQKGKEALRADVVLIPFPFTNLSKTKVRPAMVLSSSLYHSTKPDLILGAITSNLAASASVDYIIVDWRAANLRYPSAFKPLVFTLEPSSVLYKIGQLSHRDLTEIEERLRLIFDLA